MNDPPATDRDARDDLFPKTRWTLVEEIGSGGQSAERALAELCSIYWRPVYAYARGSGLSPQDAEDLTQGFFAQLIGNGALNRADASQGRLRCYLLHALKNFRIDQHRRQNAKKRGGGTTSISIDATSAEHALAAELAEHQTPESIFERRWALSLLDESFDRLAEDYDKSGKLALYTHLKHTLTGSPDAVDTHAGIAAELGMTPGAVQVAAYRLRQRFRRTLAKVIAETVESSDQVEEEQRHILTTLSKSG